MGAAEGRSRREEDPPTFRRLVSEVGTTLKELEYDQTPEVNGPMARLDGAIPMMG